MSRPTLAKTRARSQSAPDSQSSTEDPAARLDRTRTPKARWYIRITWTDAEGHQHSQDSWTCSASDAAFFCTRQRERFQKHKDAGRIQDFTIEPVLVAA